MRMYRPILITAACLCIGLTPVSASAPQSQKSETIVYIGGEKFYIHTVQPGQTLYSIARLYGVSEQTLVAYNPTMADVLKADQNVKIPVPAPQMQPDEAPLTARQEKKLRKKFILHTVEAHETLYAISKRYGISVETLLEDNENLDPTHLTIGGTLLVRKKEVGKTSNAENLAELEEYKEKLNSVPTDGFRYYVVRPGDTMYSLAHANRTTEQTLSELNEGLSSATLKAGAIIKLPTADAPATAEQPADTLTVRPPAEKLLTLALDAALRLSLLLPATTDGRPNASYTEFYQGFLLGVDQLRRDGRSVRLDVFDTAHDPAKVTTLVADSALTRSQLIVGPVYEDELAPVLRIAEQEGIPVVSPLATIDHTHSDVLFQMAPDPAQKYAKLARPLNSGRRVVLIYSQHTDTAFEQAVKALIPDVGYETFRYEQGSNIGSILSARDSALLVVLSGKETEVDSILAALASASSNIIARGHSAPQYDVIGGPHWNRFDNIDRNLFFKNRVNFISTYHAKRDDERIRTFDNRYISAFGSLPTLYSYRGYDAAVLFGSAMFDDINSFFDDETFTPLQTPYRFTRTADGNRVNTEWVRVVYNDNYTITLE